MSKNTEVITTERTLKERLEGYNSSQKLFCIALARGHTRAQAFDKMKSWNLDVQRYLLEPSFQALVEHLDGNLQYQKEADDLYREALANEYSVLLLEEAINQLKNGDLSSTTVLNQATQIAKVQKTTGGGGSYDELILKQHRAT